ncbi:assimilatory nitrate reductase catalytic subunit [Silvimonas terrae]|uniref:Assimilatory nitrate reductase catalytic subunit n=1 Tax=Silvimonas terrae TaxID=300266 RepID=A0A840RB88_9NEIS|nr:nitrate reductase [Silvimonas terrae]MBB5190177.1 assimilatory nitrate reductase catalytic subunit [Silvimonas terrae]
MKTITRSTCCYCGVGCGVLIESDGEKITGIQGDPAHPANYGRLCTKGMTLPLTVASKTNRALYPEIRINRDSERQRVDWDTALDTVALKFADIIRQHGPDAVAFYISGQLLTEDYYVFNKLAKGLIGTNNIDTNSRLCMSSAVSGYKLSLGADGPPTCYEDLELADCVLFAGSNMAWAHPVLYRRLEAAKATRADVKWIVIDPRRTDTAAMADLHLQIQPGTDVALFNGMLHHLIWEDLIDPQFVAEHTDGFAELKQLVRDYTPRMAAEICGITEADLMTAAEWFGRSQGALSLYCMGLNQSAHGTDKNLALINLHLATRQIGKPGAGPFSLTGQPNAMGGREVGGMATMLAAHRDITNADHRAEIARLWGIDTERLSPTPGLPAVEMFNAIRAGKIKALWIACTNPVHSMPDLNLIREALDTAEFVVVQEAFLNTDTVPYADVVLPAATWGEKSGTVTNSERRISRVRPAIQGPGEVRGDWWIANEVARRLEAQIHPARFSLFGFANEEQVFNEHRRLTEGKDLDITGLSYGVLESHGPQQWPMPIVEAYGETRGQARRYEDGVFATADGKARFNVTPYLPVAEPTNSRYPFHLLTGRLRDQWHGMSRTGRVPRLFAHTPEAALTMNPLDAERRGLKAGELVKVSSKRGGLILPLGLSDEVTTGSVFAAMHWNGQFLNSGGINESTIGAVDRKSFQPELKHAAVRVERADLPWRLTAACRGDTQALQAALQPLLKDCAYAAITMAGDDVAILKAAADSAPAGWLEKLFTALALQPGPDVLEYRDARRGMVKRVGWQDGVLHGFVWAGDVTGSDQLLEQLIAGEPWQGARITVFSPKTGNATRDRVVCNCKQVKESQIRELVVLGADVDGLKTKLGCGTVCGSCVPELKRMCSATAVAS